MPTGVSEPGRKDEESWCAKYYLRGFWLPLILPASSNLMAPSVLSYRDSQRVRVISSHTVSMARWEQPIGWLLEVTYSTPNTGHEAMGGGEEEYYLAAPRNTDCGPGVQPPLTATPPRTGLSLLLTAE